MSGSGGGIVDDLKYGVSWKKCRGEKFASPESSFVPAAECELINTNAGNEFVAPMQDRGICTTASKPPETSPLQKWRLKRVLRHVDEKLSERLALADLAAIAGMSRMYFARKFRASTGLSPHAYVQSRRIERAKVLLSTTKRSICAVSLETGFHSHAHFTTAFGKFVGETPTQWRRRQL